MCRLQPEMAVGSVWFTWPGLGCPGKNLGITQVGGCLDAGVHVYKHTLQTECRTQHESAIAVDADVNK